MRDSVPIARYSSVCNVLRLWRISLIPTYGLVQTILAENNVIIESTGSMIIRVADISNIHLWSENGSIYKR